MSNKQILSHSGFGHCVPSGLAAHETYFFQEVPDIPAPHVFIIHILCLRNTYCKLLYTVCPSDSYKLQVMQGIRQTSQHGDFT